MRVISSGKVSSTLTFLASAPFTVCSNVMVYPTVSPAFTMLGLTVLVILSSGISS